MRLAWQPALALVLTTVGVLLLDLAVLDWSAYDFAALETSLHEWRVYGRIASDYFSDPWSPFEWWDVVESAPHGLMMACLALVGGLAALAAAWLVRHRRAAGHGVDRHPARALSQYRGPAQGRHLLRHAKPPGCRQKAGGRL